MSKEPIFSNKLQRPKLKYAYGLTVNIPNPFFGVFPPWYIVCLEDKGL